MWVLPHMGSQRQLLFHSTTMTIVISVKFRACNSAPKLLWNCSGKKVRENGVSVEAPTRTNPIINSRTFFRAVSEQFQSSWNIDGRWLMYGRMERMEKKKSFISWLTFPAIPAFPAFPARIKTWQSMTSQPRDPGLGAATEKGRSRTTTWPAAIQSDRSPLQFKPQHNNTQLNSK